MLVEKVLVDTVCDCCLIEKPDIVRIELDEDNIFILCPSCIRKLTELIKSQTIIEAISKFV